ncbi:GGDEF domain-containing protein [Viridibacterium curvum]|uniref:diguanylate cyclase n=1 Tax=Viridibacterium curvum TaxID=1101404 RepID=A0ABP9QDL0_9RHOO
MEPTPLPPSVPPTHEPPAIPVPADWEAALRTYLKVPPFWLAFPEAIESVFLHRAHGSRIHRFRQSLYASMALFAVLALCDVLLLSTFRVEALSIRFGAIAATLLAVFFLPRAALAPHRESFIAGVFALLCVAQAVISLHGGQRALLLYDEVLILGLLLCNQVARVRFRQAAPFTLFWTLLYIATVQTRDSPDVAALIFKCGFILLVALISLYTKRAMELDNRNTFALRSLNTIAGDKLNAVNAELSAQARFDTLTSLPNRRQFEEHAERMLRDAARNQSNLSVLYVDIDYFKAYNDHYGHKAGDDCLCVVASVLRFTTARALDMSARYGGEEFVIILPDTRLNNAISFALDLCQNLRELKVPHDASPIQRVSVSIGVTGRLITPDTTLSDLLSEADAALYKAKSAGRDQVYPPA